MPTNGIGHLDGMLQNTSKTTPDRTQDWLRETPVRSSESSASRGRSCPSLVRSYIRRFRMRPIRARLSIDFRTVHIDDLVALAGPENVDSRSTGTSVRDYLRADTGESLPDEVIALYDRDGSTTVSWYSIRPCSARDHKYGPVG